MGIKQLIHPYYLTWENREKIPDMIDLYDVQIYLEDDIKFTQDNLNYWLQHKESILSNGFNLGFLRIELDEKQCYLTDLSEELTETVEIENQLFLINNNNPYCGFWIYSKNELREFIKSEEWFFRFKDYDRREKSAIGWHGKNMSRYKETLIPLMNDGKQYLTVKECAVYHLPNNYIGQSNV